ncbi:hypothetical protein N7492_009848 [Penicillium capsulatum]|uniref:Uncharacterized protein n=1 Tax=Penicillium capsulatum TaxID=69766 RepID=A0A9W9LEL7_9EURO|nr:hypothetical protein N7492_009848 [Penicillium capsulatum]KAJ6112359.1 hypothetical protein N7512_007683 [Penicillium capsulatum]
MDHRSRALSNRSHRNGSWTPSEDERLRHAVASQGTNWSAVARAVWSRNGEQCSKRWKNALNPQLDHSPWTKDEDCHLQRLVLEHGRNWKLIAERHSKTRSALALKNRSALLLRRETRQESQRRSSMSSLDYPLIPGECGEMGSCSDVSTRLQNSGPSITSLFSDVSSTDLESADRDWGFLRNESSWPHDPADLSFVPGDVGELFYPNVDSAFLDSTAANPLSVGSAESSSSPLTSVTMAEQEILSLNIPCSRSRKVRLVQSLLDVVGGFISEEEEEGKEGSEMIQLKVMAMPKGDVLPRVM